MLGNPQRTYLWVTVILEIVSKRPDLIAEELPQILKKIPPTIADACEAILSKTEDRERTEKILHIIIAAIRPLTLKELNVALAVKNNRAALGDLALLPEHRFRMALHNYCGLFVTIIGPNVSLIHQIAKEFLASRDTSQLACDAKSDCRTWGKTLELAKSHLILAEVCLSYLLFTGWEKDNLLIDNRERSGEQRVRWYAEYDFLECAAKSWATHIKQSGANENAAIMNLVLEVCHP
ncbi:hypothetical protein K469DRAFT_684008 [Zopfia rhizophila CBS 207.26]|uniref:GPI inositol-deacylase winged helix domain-containing protein n=1 Tax=Zopfia rhizophila CBS 207.26 TaxID=1314779 RepID=A0A6A6D896_9PEZI|nr:hypothetical protein K469DRAFT_684008 [Zopfia rhizophila CBS 207.26]